MPESKIDNSCVDVELTVQELVSFLQKQIDTNPEVASYTLVNAYTNPIDMVYMYSENKEVSISSSID